MKKIKTIAWHTLGCKLNFSETSSIIRQFGNEGYEQVDFTQPADLYVVNSCTVTKNAEKTCKALIRKAMRTNPQARVAVIGCFSQINPQELKAIPGVDIVLGNADKFNLFEHIQTLEQNQNGSYIKEVAVDEPVTFIPSWSQDDRTRSFFKIQDGCDYFCSYCTIPLARGRSRSNTIAATLESAKEIAQTRLKEIVLTGVNIGDFGKQHGETFFDLLKGLVRVDGLERIRISSVEPDLLTDDIIDLVAAQSRLMPHFHIPLQSGSDTVLKAMGRRYTRSTFASRVEKIRSVMPHACIAVDLIVGFPAETDELFEESMNFIRSTGVSYVHVFTYSQRDNTAALKITSQVSVAQRQHRSRLMHQLSEEMKEAFYQQNMGSTHEVLWESQNMNGLMSGFTDNYLKVSAPYRKEWCNNIMPVCLNNLTDQGFSL